MLMNISNKDEVHSSSRPTKHKSTMSQQQHEKVGDKYSDEWKYEKTKNNCHYYRNRRDYNIIIKIDSDSWGPRLDKPLFYLYSLSHPGDECFVGYECDTLDDFLEYIGHDAEEILELFYSIKNGKRNSHCETCDEYLFKSSSKTKHVMAHIHQKRYPVKSANKT